MNPITKYLFFIALGLSLVSLVFAEKGLKEIYPFASWKLFTVPSGGLKVEERYVLFGLKNSDTIRIIHTPDTYYEANDKALITDTYGYKIEQNEEVELSKKKLKIFAKDIAPQFDNYLVYKESYHPKEIGGRMKSTTFKMICKL